MEVLVARLEVAISDSGVRTDGGQGWPSVKACRKRCEPSPRGFVVGMPLGWVGSVAVGDRGPSQESSWLFRATAARLGVMA